MVTYFRYLQISFPVERIVMGFLDPSAAKRIGWSAVVTLLIAAIVACSNSGNPLRTPSVLHRGLAGEPSTLDPAAAADNFSNEVLRDLYEGLTTESPTGEVIPGVAESWSIDLNGTKYVFHIRQTARWSNGHQIRAQDFVTAWQRVVDPKQASPVADDLRIVARANAIIAGKVPPSDLGVRALSDDTLEITLEEPAPYLPQLLTHVATYPIFSESAAHSHDVHTWVSNGPFTLSAWSPGTSLKLNKNPGYWNHEHVLLDAVEYQISPDENSQYARYRDGILDVTDTVPANAISALRSAKSSELRIAPFLATAYYGLNLSGTPFSRNAELRQAVAMAIDRRRLVTALGFEQAPAFGFVPPGTWNYSPQKWEWQSLNDADRIAEAQRLFAKAGYSTAKPLRLRLLFNSNPAIKSTAVIIATMLKETLGIETIMVEEEYRVFLDSRHDKSRWDMARLGWIADYNDASNFLDAFRVHSANNDPGYSNSVFDSLLDRAEGTANAEERRGLLEAAEKTILDDYPIVPLYFYVSKRLVKPYVTGAAPNPLNRLSSANLAIARH